MKTNLQAKRESEEEERKARQAGQCLLLRHSCPGADSSLLFADISADPSVISYLSAQAGGSARAEGEGGEERKGEKEKGDAVTEPMEVDQDLSLAGEPSGLQEGPFVDNVYDEEDDDQQVELGQMSEELSMALGLMAAVPVSTRAERERRVVHLIENVAPFLAGTATYSLNGLIGSPGRVDWSTGPGAAALLQMFPTLRQEEEAREEEARQVSAAILSVVKKFQESLLFKKFQELS